jgi:lysophospholipase L1-like esterase
MADKKPEVFPETGWCQALKNHLTESVTLNNYAVNGRSSKSFIDEGRWEIITDSLKAGDYVFIQFGHNDEKRYDSTRYTTPFGTYTANLTKFVKETREKDATPILFTSIVRRKFNDSGTLMATHSDYPEAVRQVAKDLSVHLIDLQETTKEWIESLGDEDSKAMYLWTEANEEFPHGRKDDTHLSEKGANVVAQMVLKECRRKKLDFATRKKEML